MSGLGISALVMKRIPSKGEPLIEDRNEAQLVERGLKVSEVLILGKG